MMSQLVLSSPWVLAGRYFLLSIRGTRGLVARLDATFRGIRGIGEGVVVQRERGAVQFVQFVQLLCSQQMA